MGIVGRFNCSGLQNYTDPELQQAIKSNEGELVTALIAQLPNFSAVESAKDLKSRAAQSAKTIELACRVIRYLENEEQLSKLSEAMATHHIWPAENAPLVDHEQVGFSLIEAVKLENWAGVKCLVKHLSYFPQSVHENLEMSLFKTVLARGCTDAELLKEIYEKEMSAFKQDLENLITSIASHEPHFAALPLDQQRTQCASLLIEAQNQKGESFLKTLENNPACLRALLPYIKPAQVIFDHYFQTLLPHPEILSECIDRNPSSLHSLPISNEPPLHSAVKSNQRAAIDLLLQRGADINARNHKGVPPIFMAANNICLLQYLLQRGASPHVTDTKGNTLFHEVCKSFDGDFQAVLGTVPISYAANSAGYAPMHLLAKRNKKKELALLFKDCYSLDPNTEEGKEVFARIFKSPRLFSSLITLVPQDKRASLSKAVLEDPQYEALYKNKNFFNEVQRHGLAKEEKILEKFLVHLNPYSNKPVSEETGRIVNKLLLEGKIAYKKQLLMNQNFIKQAVESGWPNRVAIIRESIEVGFFSGEHLLLIELLIKEAIKLEDVIDMDRDFPSDLCHTDTIRWALLIGAPQQLIENIFASYSKNTSNGINVFLQHFKEAINAIVLSGTQDLAPSMTTIPLVQNYIMQAIKSSPALFREINKKKLANFLHVCIYSVNFEELFKMASDEGQKLKDSPYAQKKMFKIQEYIQEICNLLKDLNIDYDASKAMLPVTNVPSEMSSQTLITYIHDKAAHFPKKIQNLQSFAAAFLELLNRKELMLDAENRTTLLVLAEKIVHACILEGRHQEAAAISCTAAAAIPAEETISQAFQALITTDRFNQAEGVYITAVGAATVKNGSLHLSIREIDGRQTFCIRGMISHTARTAIQALIENYAKEAGAILKNVPADFCSGIKISLDAEDGYYIIDNLGKFSSTNICKIGQAIAIEFEGVGKIFIGNSPDVLSNYNRIRFEIDASINPADIPAKVQIMAACIGLPTLLSAQRDVDNERMKIFQILRTFAPELEFYLSRQEKFYNLPPLLLRNVIAKQAPWLEEKMAFYLEQNPGLLYKQEVYKGFSVWALNGVADQLKDKGALGFVAYFITPGQAAEAGNILSKILKQGMLSTQERYENGWIISGASSQKDLEGGGGNSAFVRLMTPSLLNKSSGSLAKLTYKMALIIDLKLAERAPYGYEKDEFGTKSPDIYQNRASLSELVDYYELIEDKEDLETYCGNEVMIQKSVPPAFIKGVMVGTLDEKQELLIDLRKNGLVLNAEGKETINGIPAEEFIVVSNSMKASFWGSTPAAPAGTLSFPDRLHDVTVLNHNLGGSTGAKLVRAGTQKYIVKAGMTFSHCETEYLTNRIYKILGKGVPDAKMYTHLTRSDLDEVLRKKRKPVEKEFEGLVRVKNKAKKIILHFSNFTETAIQRKKPANPLPGKAIKGEARRILFEFIKGEPLTKIRSDPNRRVELEAIYAELRQGFVADCFLANRDVLGADFDNILVTPGGEVYRIDQGGCLEYRAQGELKSDFGDEVLELQTMRDPALNPNTAAVFSPITEEEIRLQIQEIYAKKEEILALPMPPLLKQRLENRLQFLVEYASGPTLRL